MVYASYPDAVCFLDLLCTVVHQRMGHLHRPQSTPCFVTVRHTDSIDPQVAGIIKGAIRRQVELTRRYCFAADALGGEVLQDCVATLHAELKHEIVCCFAGNREHCKQALWGVVHVNLAGSLSWVPAEKALARNIDDQSDRWHNAVVECASVSSVEVMRYI